MRDFEYYNPARIVFGKNALEKLPDLIKRHSGCMMLHYGQSSIKRSGLYERVVKILEETAAEWIELGGVEPNPDYALVKEGIALCREHSVTWILAVGGGSVIDSAKAIAAGVFVGRGEDYWDDYFIKEMAPENSLPVGSIVTIPASGSETSYECVISNHERKEKRTIGNDAMIPEFTLIDPQLHMTLPPYQTACGCADILSHLLERYFTQLPDVDLTDRMLEGCMRTIINYAPLALEEPDNYEVRAEIAWTGTIAHNRLLDTGRRGDWATHEMQHAAGALFPMAHGAGLAVLFPAWMKHVWKKNPDRFLQFAQRVWHIDYAAEHKERIILAGIEKQEEFFAQLRLPKGLREFGIQEGDITALVDKLFSGRTELGRFMPLGRADAEEIYRNAL